MKYYCKVHVKYKRVNTDSGGNDSRKRQCTDRQIRSYTLTTNLISYLPHVQTSFPIITFVFSAIPTHFGMDQTSKLTKCMKSSIT